MQEYMKLQIKYIRKYAKHIDKSADDAAIEWSLNGLAKQFAILYREQYGLIKERV